MIRFTIRKRKVYWRMESYPPVYVYDFADWRSAMNYVVGLLRRA